MDEPILQFSTITGLSFAIIGIAVLLLITLHVYTVVVLTKHFRFAIRVEKSRRAAEAARREIQERDRVRIAKMIRRKVTPDEWIEFLAQLGEDPTQGERHA